MPAPIKRKSTFIVNSFETLKVVNDSLRIQLMDEINLANDRGELRTVKELASTLETDTHKLYYHMRMLEEHGLIHVAETKIVSGIIEKHYALTAVRIQVSEQLFNKGETTVEKTSSAVALFDSAAQSTRRDFVTLMESTKADREHLATFSGRGAHFTQERILLTQEQAISFQAKLQALTEEFSLERGNAGEENGAVYNLMTVFIPSLQAGADESTPHTTGETQS